MFTALTTRWVTSPLIQLMSKNFLLTVHIFHHWQSYFRNLSVFDLFPYRHCPRRSKIRWPRPMRWRKKPARQWEPCAASPMSQQRLHVMQRIWLSHTNWKWKKHSPTLDMSGLMRYGTKHILLSYMTINWLKLITGLFLCYGKPWCWFSIQPERRLNETVNI